ncbi:hypothetical protein KIH24_15130 [Rhizobiales bacterium TNE-4]|nr:hypothetical protein [Rhizobiales bacterium TNE-4]MBV1828956.1 hypothetical protein [Rhizobiales bacterium TNE-4]
MNIVVPAPQTESHYPAVTNALVNDPTPQDQAIYIPSVSPGYAMTAYAKDWKRPLPDGVIAEDMNFLDPANKLFRISHVMSSAGQALSQARPCIITERDRSTTLMVGDSGGYQIASGRLKITSDDDKLTILRWLEQHADVAMTLDVPTGPVLKPGYPYRTSRDCLAATEHYLAFFQKHRKSSHTRFLNVLQGNTTQESDAWYKAVKKYEFEGWAFAGVLRHNFFNLCRRLMKMLDENQLKTKSWIHVLGTNDLETAIGLTAIQRALTKHVGTNIRISYDTSSPFRNLSWGNIYTTPRFERQLMSMPTAKIPDDPRYVGSSLRFPWPSPLGNKLTMGDICIRCVATGDTTLDLQSQHYMALHNLAALCDGVALANRVFDSESVTHKHSIGAAIGAAVEAIDDIFRTGEEEKLLKYRTTFLHLRHGQEPGVGDEDRCL